MGGAKQAGKDPSVLSAVLLQKRRRGEKTLILVKRLSDSEESTSRPSLPRSARTSRTSRKAPCLGTSCKPLWSRPRSTRSRSGHSSSTKTGPSTGGSPRNCLFLPRGPRMKVPSPPQICQMTANITLFSFIACTQHPNITSCVLCSPGSRLVAQHPDLLLHLHFCGHGLLHHLLRRHGLSQVGPLLFPPAEISAVY